MECEPETARVPAKCNVAVLSLVLTASRDVKRCNLYFRSVRPRGNLDVEVRHHLDRPERGSGPLCGICVARNRPG